MSKMVKRTLAGVLMVSMVLVAGSMSTFAAGTGTGKNFTDANEDGICDYRENECSYAGADNDGICDQVGSRNRQMYSDESRACDHSVHRDGMGNKFRGGHGR